MIDGGSRLSSDQIDRGRNEGLNPRPSLQTGQAVFPHPAFQSVVSSRGRRDLLGLRLRRSTRASRLRHRSSASMDCSCERSRQAIEPHACCITLPCLASGTRGSLFCRCVSLMLPPSYPPWLGDHYSLLRYYEGSDSCPAPSSTRTGLLDYGACTSRPPVSNHPMRPCPCHASGSGQAWPPIRLGSYRRFVGLRSLHAVSSVASGRIEFVSRIIQDPSVL